MGLVIRCAALLALASCLPVPHEYVGGACDVDHPCPAPLECRADVCQHRTDAGEPRNDGGARDNRLRDGDFELGNTVFSWHGSNALAVDGQTMRTGFYGARLSGPGPHVLTSNDLRIDLRGNTGTFCSEAWARGQGAASVSLKLRPLMPPIILSADRPEAHAALVTTTWTALHTRIVVQPNALDLVWELNVEQPGAATFVDDVTVWPSADGGCE